MGKKKQKAARTAGDEAPAAGADAAAPGSAEAGAAGASADAGPGPAADAPPQPKPSSAPLPFEKLPPDFLGGFFELCFPDRQLLALCRELTLTAPGYRLEALPLDQVARMLADEALAAKDARLLLDAAVRKALVSPALEDVPLSREQLGGLLDLQLTGDPLQHLARTAWKALLEEGAEEAALDAIDDGLDALQVQAQAGRPEKKPPRPAPPDARQAEEAVKRAERAEKERAAAREQLAAARADIAAREQKLSEQARELAGLRGEQARLSAELARLLAAGEGRALSDARRALDEARSLSEKLRAAEAALAEAEEGRRAAEQRAREAEKARAAPAPAAEAADAELPTEEQAEAFLVPVLTREFYDSIAGWSRRMQRAAFDKIHLLAHDWRHGSLRALPLEGLPGYYRIRVATDVRLIYRREGGQLEVLSLIDREDLDRYVRQARTRPG